MTNPQINATEVCTIQASRTHGNHHTSPFEYLKSFKTIFNHPTDQKEK